jgi:hypothetical protein
MLFTATVAAHAIFTGDTLEQVMSLVSTFHDPNRDVTIWRGNRIEAVVVGSGFVLLVPPVSLKVRQPADQPPAPRRQP